MSKPKKPRKELPMAPPGEDPHKSSVYEVMQMVEAAHLMSADTVHSILEMYLHTVRDRLVKNGSDYLPGIGTVTMSKRPPSLGSKSRNRCTVKMDHSFKQRFKENSTSDPQES